MKIYLGLIVFLSLFMLFFPLAVSAGGNAKTDMVTASEYEQTRESESTQGAEETESQKNKAENSTADTIKVLRASSGRVVDVALYDYVVGCVASEMPAYYEREALKAQAVVCYTYAKWITQNSDSGKLDGAQVSDSAEKHQKYMDESELKKKFGDKYDSYISRIKECVNEVLGEYLTYENEPIMACYHALSAGQTQSAKTVWGNDIAYLQSVSAPGDELSPNFDNSVSLTQAQFKEKVQAAGITGLSKTPSDRIKITEKNKSGYIIKAKIGNKTLTGTEVRNLFSLESAVFTVEYANGKFTFKTKGKGHQIGMSQYCADYMARQGKTYKDILLHFYPGTALTAGRVTQ